MASHNLTFNDRDRVTYTTEQLTEIYEKSGRSADINKLRNTALELFPDILDDGAPPIFIYKGSGRAYPVDGDYTNTSTSWRTPTHMLRSNACFGLDIMEDSSYRIG